VFDGAFGWFNASQKSQDGIEHSSVGFPTALTALLKLNGNTFKTCFLFIIRIVLN
jgi:hypothetical protein